MIREIKDITKTPLIFFAASIFYVLCGYMFYNNVVAFIEYSTYYPQHMYSIDAFGIQGDLYEIAFAPFFRFVGLMIVIIVPIISCNLGSDRLNNLDKVELLGTGKSELAYIFRRMISSILITGILVFPVALFPLVLVPFAEINYNYIVTTYVAMLGVIVLSTSLSMPIAVSKFSLSISVFLNVSILVPLYLYFFEYKYLPYYTGVVNLAGLLWPVILFFMSIYTTKYIYRSTRIYS